MSKMKFFLAVLLPALFVCGTAFGWAGNTHAKLCQRTFDDPVVSPLLGGINQSEIENWMGEPGDWQDGQWANVAARAYIDTGVSPNGLNWQGLDETTRLKYMTHNLADVAVPIGHSPANTVYSNTVNEAILEAQVATWTTWPSVQGTCNYTHNRNGHSYSFTGTYDQVLNTFYNACIDNATWFKSTKKWWGGHTTTDNRDAGWNGTTLALMLQRASFVDYQLAKQDVVAQWETYPIGYAGDYIHLTQAAAYDPDCVSWNSNGTYTQLYGIHTQGIQYCLWDVNGDVPYGGNWDYGAYAVDGWIPVNDLIAMGVPTNEWTLFYTAVVDNEGKVGYAADYMYLVSGGAPEPASLSLLAIGGLALLRRRKK